MRYLEADAQGSIPTYRILYDRISLTVLAGRPSLNLRLNPVHYHLMRTELTIGLYNNIDNLPIAWFRINEDQGFLLKPRTADKKRLEPFRLLDDPTSPIGSSVPIPADIRR